MRYINKNDVLIIARNSGIMMIGIGVLCLVPIIVDLIYLEFNAIGFLIPALISICSGLFCIKVLDKYTINKIRLKHGMIISTLSWLWACLICALAFYLITGINIIDAAFESMSALTGSGITIYSDVEVLPHSILFFRALQQWVGGLGIIVMIITFLIKPGNKSSTLYQSEAREDRIRPSTKATIKETLKIYLIYTVFGIILYLLAGMPIFDSVCNTFCIISTGGMSVKNANIGFYQSDLIYFITMILMILGATSFLVHYKIIKTRGKSLIQDLQFKVMISLIAISSLIIYFVSHIVPMEVLFTVVSAVTTTGASIQSSTALGAWPPFALFIIMMLMLMGGSNGSTVGAIKLMRVITFSKGIYKNLREIWSPEGSVVPMEISGEKLSEKVSTQSGNYITLYFLCILFTWTLLCLYGHDPFNSLFFTMSMQGNVGLEIGQLSQTIELPLKVIGMFNMWTGRLEIYPVLITLRALFEVFKR
ncbi:TrkH family potassium uptake protein [uncultured Methanobrevibacter sp.]|uniref:TrkH family potassium uptake protein n=1 Tax=uncultured Methanobrevibacter sp. TaxID=253161 RepID=UPI0026369FE7|nr:TrkH family potassium uptake protein [uncultured Methanobrevibacter sp.]